MKHLLIGVALSIVGFHAQAKTCTEKSKVIFHKDAQIYMSMESKASFLPMIRKGSRHNVASGTCVTYSKGRDGKTWLAYRRDVGGSVMHYVLADSVQVSGSQITVALGETEY